MYRRTKQFVKDSKLAPTTYVEGVDIFNSELLYRLDNIQDFETYTISKYEHRWDLIALDIYGTSDYAWMLQYMNKLPVKGLMRGVTLKYISLYEINKILAKL